MRMRDIFTTEPLDFTNNNKKKQNNNVHITRLICFLKELYKSRLNINPYIKVNCWTFSSNTCCSLCVKIPGLPDWIVVSLI